VNGAIRVAPKPVTTTARSAVSFGFIVLALFRRTTELSDSRPAAVTSVTLNNRSAPPKSATLELRSGAAVRSSDFVRLWSGHRCLTNSASGGGLPPTRSMLITHSGFRFNSSSEAPGECAFWTADP
jgi:hypothetical protein